MNFIRKNASEDGNDEIVKKCDSLLPGDVSRNYYLKTVIARFCTSVHELVILLLIPEPFPKYRNKCHTYFTSQAKVALFSYYAPPPLCYRIIFN